MWSRLSEYNEVYFLPTFRSLRSYSAITYAVKLRCLHLIPICRGMHLHRMHMCQCSQFTSPTHLLKLLDSWGFAVIVFGRFWFWFVWVQNASWFYMKLWILGCLTMTANAQRSYQTPENPHPSAPHNIPEYLNLYDLIWEPEILHPQIEPVGSQKQFSL